MISITGEPYDTLQTVIGCNETESKSSLKAFGIKYEQIELVENDFDIKSIQERLKKQDVKLVEIQRSRGYSTRKSLTIEKQGFPPAKSLHKTGKIISLKINKNKS